MAEVAPGREPVKARLRYASLVTCFFVLTPIRSQAQSSNSQPTDSCDGKVWELPADVVGRPYRAQCYRGIEIVAWADSMPARSGKKRRMLCLLSLSIEQVTP